MKRFRQGTTSGIAMMILVFLLLTTTTAPALEAQDSARVSATMLRVLAEAADAERTGQPVFFVADYRFPHQVLGPFGSRDEAARLQADSGSTFAVFGPYTTPTEPGVDTASRVVGIRITMMTRRGRQTLDLDPRKVDALFLSGAAADKFVIPFYSRVYGPEYAQRLRNRIDRVAMVLCHVRPSYLCMPRPDGSLNIIRPMDR